MRDPLAYQGNNLKSVGFNMNYTNGTFETNLDHFNTSDSRKFNIRHW